MLMVASGLSARWPGGGLIRAGRLRERMEEDWVGLLASASAGCLDSCPEEAAGGALGVCRRDAGALVDRSR